MKVEAGIEWINGDGKSINQSINNKRTWSVKEVNLYKSNLMFLDKMLMCVWVEARCYFSPGGLAPRTIPGRLLHHSSEGCHAACFVPRTVTQ